MAAGSWKDWAQGELVTESGFQDIQDSVVFIYASEAAANAALTNKVKGTIFFDTTAEVLKAWDGVSAWISAETGDISSVIAGTNLNGGGTSGDVTLNLDSTLTGIADVQDSGNTSLLGRKNYIINGNFDIWQRGTSGTGGYCSADRWSFNQSGSTGTLAQGSFTAGQTDVPNNPRYFANLTITGADDNANISQRIEDVYTLAGDLVTVSFYFKHTTNAPTDFKVNLKQIFGSGGSTFVSTSVSSGNTTTTSWQKFTGTITVPSISGKTVGSGSYLELEIVNPNNETFDIQIAQVQIEKGSVATDFEYRSIGEELALCQRYYQETPQGVVYQLFGHYQNTTSFYGFYNYKGTMRTSPSISFVYSTIGDIGVLNANANTTATSIAVLNQNAEFATIDVTTAARTQGDGGNVRMQNNAHIELDAEL